MPERQDDIEWWVLVDPKTNSWRQVSEAEARRYPVVEGRLRYAVSTAAIEMLLRECEEER